MSAMVTATCALLAGCATGPDYVRPAVDVGVAFTEGAPAVAGGASEAGQGHGGHGDRRDADIAADWWRAYRNPALDELIQSALAANPDVEAARHALTAAEALRQAQRGALFPALQAQYTPTRTKLAGNQGGNSPGIQGDGRVISTGAGTPAAEGGTAPFNSPVIYNFHTAQLSLSYAPDLFGGTRRGIEAAQAQVLLQRHEWQAARMTLVSQLVAAALLDASLREQIALATRNVETATEAHGLIARQRRAGLVAAQDEAAQAGALAALRLALVPLEVQAEQNRNLMRALAGAPQDRVMPAFRLEDFHRPDPLPVALPSALFEQRPDVRAAEASLRAASAQIGVARAQRLPQFDISANLGGGAAHLSQMFWPSGRFFDLTGQLVAPLFDGGAGRQREAAARSQYLQAQAQYRAVVLHGLQNVADVLRAIDGDRPILSAAEAAEAAAARALSIAERQLKAGYADGVALRTAQVNQGQARATVVAARAAELTNTAALFQALGGGWWNDTSERDAEDKDTR